MADSLRELLIEPLTDLHDTIIAHFNDRTAGEILGDALIGLRGSGTGKSLVMLALLNDSLQAIEIVLGEKPQHFPVATEFVAPFIRTATRTFDDKGISAFGPYTKLSGKRVPEFLAFHRNYERPFGGRHRKTAWCGMHMCLNAARRFQDPSIIYEYGRPMHLLIDSVTKCCERRAGYAAVCERAGQLRDFLSDSCDEAREGVTPHSASPEPAEEARLTEWEQRLQGEQQLLEKLKADLESQRQQLEADRAALWHEREELSAERERLTTDRAALAAMNAAPAPLQEVESPEPPEVPVATAVPAARANEELVAAVIAGDADRARSALAAGADANHVDSMHNWQTPLLLAAGGGHREIAELLLRHEAQADFTNEEGNNALLVAVVSGRTEVAELLAKESSACVQQAEPKLLRILRDPHSPVDARLLSVMALGRVGESALSAIPTLLSLLESESRELVRASALAITRIDSSAVAGQAIPYVSYILDSPANTQAPADLDWIANVYAARGDLYAEIGRHAQALPDYEDSLRFRPHPDNPDWQARAETAASLDRHGPADALAAYRSGLTAESQGKSAEALMDWERSAAADPLFPWSRERLAWLMSAGEDATLHDGPAAVEWARQACRLVRTEEWRLLRTLAFAFARSEQFEEAVETMQEAQEAAPPEVRPELERFTSQFRDGKFE